MTQLFTVIGLLLTAGIGVFKWWQHLTSEKKKRAEEAMKLFKEAEATGDISKINAAIARLKSRR